MEAILLVCLEGVSEVVDESQDASEPCEIKLERPLSVHIILQPLNDFLSLLTYLLIVRLSCKKSCNARGCLDLCNGNIFLNLSRFFEH